MVTERIFIEVRREYDNGKPSVVSKAALTPRLLDAEVNQGEMLVNVVSSIRSIALREAKAAGYES